MNFGQDLKWLPDLVMETTGTVSFIVKMEDSWLMRCYHHHIRIQKNQLLPSVGGEVAELGSPEPLAISLEEILEDVPTFTTPDRDKNVPTVQEASFSSENVSKQSVILQQSFYPSNQSRLLLCLRRSIWKKN